MDSRMSIFIFINLVSLQPALSDAEPSCGVCAPKFEYEFKVLQKLADLENKQKILEEKVETQKEQIIKQNEQIDRHVISQKSILEKLGKASTDNLNTGVTYVRWGKTTCPGNGTDIVYRGTMAGNHYNKYGGGANQLCMPEEPTWGQYIDGYNSGAQIHGAEIEVDGTVSGRLFGKQATNNDLPCAVCLSTRVSHIMLPARINCYPGWTKEYTGYLVASYPDWKGASNFICLDSGLDPLFHGSSGNDEHVVKPVEVKCGSLPCPPYVEGREAACVVCTK